jgi:hypothetical protein
MDGSDLDVDLQAAAQEEIERACDLGWARLAQVTPWGDTYEGYTPGGRDVCFERNYLWAGDPGYDIRVEVVVYEARDYEHGARLARVLGRDAQSA